jgi:hypothetical protein
MEENTEKQVVAVIQPAALMKQAQEVAGLCRDIVKKTVVSIGKGNKARNYVKVEGWQAIANAFNCVGAARDVTKVYDEASGEFLGFRAIGEVRRLSDSQIISGGEGFVGCDEVRWFGGEADVWDVDKRKFVTKKYDPAPEYMSRAMCQTRAISRACRAAFAFVVVLIDENLSTTPAEEVAPGDEPHGQEKAVSGREVPTGAENESGGETKPWQEVVCSYGKKGGKLREHKLGTLTTLNLNFLYREFCASGRAIEPKDREMAAALIRWAEETGDFRE